MSFFAPKPPAPYNYQPIAESSRTFRLLRILPPKKAILPGFNGTSRIELVHAEFDSGIPYDALSYAWNIPKGKTKPDRLVIVETEYGPRVLRIFRQLELALIHMQATSNRLLFVDQLCINQTDAAEKEHQVKLMRDVYSRCVQTVIWLGAGTRASDQYFSYMTNVTSEGILSRVIGQNVGQFMNVFDAVMDPTREVTESEKEDRDDILQLISRYGPEFPLDGIADVLERGWFNRLWTIQEACLPPGVLFVCGNKRLCYDCFRSGMLFFNICNNYWLRNLTTAVPERSIQKRMHIQDLNAGMIRIIQERRAIHQSGIRRSLFDVILKYNIYVDEAKIGATLPEDRIFGLLGLTADDDALGARVTVDYQTGVHRVYTRTAAVLMDHNIDILLLSQFPKELPASGSLPSWVPDWSMRLKVPHSYRDLSTPVFSAGSGNGAQKLEYNETLGTLELRGMLLDTVAYIGQETLSVDPEKRYTELLDYRSANKVFSEASQFMKLALESSGSILSCSSEDLELKSLQLANAGLTLRDFTESFGPQEGIQKLRSCHETIDKLGAALIRGDNFVQSYRLGRIFQATGIVPWYANFISEWEILGFLAKDPVAAAKLFLRGAVEFLADAVLLCATSAYVSVVPWRIWLRKKLSGVTLNIGKEKARNVFDKLEMDSTTAIAPYMHTFCENLLKNKGRRLYRTGKGYVGMGPAHMDIGDGLFVFPGSTVPHILRSQSQLDVGGGGSWSYVGEAYCDGIMDGEAFKPAQQDLHTFTLV